MMTTLAESRVVNVSFWQITGFEVGLLIAGAIITLGILGVFIFILTRKEQPPPAAP